MPAVRPAGVLDVLLVLLVFAEILDGFCADNCSGNPVEGNLLTSGGIPGPRSPDFWPPFLHCFSLHVFLTYFSWILTFILTPIWHYFS